MKRRRGTTGEIWTDADLAAYVEKNPDTERLDIEGSQVTSQGLACLVSLTRLRELSLRLTDVKGEAAPMLPASLKIIDLGETEVGDQWLACLPRSLQCLNLQDTAVTDAAIEFLGGLKRLKEIDLQGTAISFDARDKLYRRRRPKLRINF
jgi:hypothetical protein